MSISPICSSSPPIGMFYNELFVSRNNACWLLVNWKCVGRLFTFKRPEGKRILDFFASNREERQTREAVRNNIIDVRESPPRNNIIDA